MAKLKEMDVPIEGMHCASCVLSVNKTFEREEGVEAVDADLSSNKLHITVNPKKINYDEMDSIVKNLGFELHSDEVTLRIDGMHCASCTMNVENFLIRLDGIFDVKLMIWKLLSIIWDLNCWELMGKQKLMKKNFIGKIWKVKEIVLLLV